MLQYAAHIQASQLARFGPGAMALLAVLVAAPPAAAEPVSALHFSPFMDAQGRLGFDAIRATGFEGNLDLEGYDLTLDADRVRWRAHRLVVGKLLRIMR